MGAAGTWIGNLSQPGRELLECGSEKPGEGYSECVFEMLRADCLTGLRCCSGLAMRPDMGLHESLAQPGGRVYRLGHDSILHMKSRNTTHAIKLEFIVFMRQRSFFTYENTTIYFLI